jgi:hypothetical protein
MGIISTTYPPAPAVTAPVIDASGIIEEGWTRAQVYADQAYSGALGKLAELRDVAVAIADVGAVSDPIDTITGEVTAFVMPDGITSPDLTPNFPIKPDEPALGYIAPIDVSDAPVWDGVRPSLNLDIPVPDALTVNAPSAPVLDAVVIPSQPDIDLPAVPTLTDVVIPDMPVIELPVFDAALGDTPVTPNISFAFAEEAYTSDLLASIKANLLRWVDGAATGLEPGVEDALWNRARDREQTAGAGLAQDAIRQFAVRGFTSPPGALAVALQRAAQAVSDNSVTVSRDIAIKQAELEQANRRFAFEQAWQVESGLISYAGQIAARALDASKYTAQILLDVFRAEVERYNAEVNAFSTRAEVFKTLLQGELAKLDILRAQIEAQKLVGEVNQQLVALFVARVGAAGQVIELFKASVQAAGTVAEVQKTKIQAFGAEVQAYGETVRAKASEYDMMATRVKAEVSKAEVYKIDADAYASQVGGFAALMRARVDVQNSDIKVNQELPVELYKARAGVFETVVKSESERLKAIGSSFETSAKLFDAEVRGESARVGADVDVFKATTEANSKLGELTIRAAEVNVDNARNKMAMLIEAAKAGATVSAQLAASALSGINFSSGTSMSYSNSASNSASNSTSNSVSQSSSISNSYSESHNYSE